MNRNVRPIKKWVGIIWAVVPAVRGLAELRRLLICAGITIFWKWMKVFFPWVDFLFFFFKANLA